MKKSFYLALAFIAALITTSCNKNENNDMVVSQTIPGCYSNVVDNTTGESTLSSGLTLSLSINYTRGNAEIILTGLKLPDGTSYANLKLSELPITQTEGWYVINAQSGKVDTGTSNVPTVESIGFKLLERYIAISQSSEYQPAFALSFVINSKYTVYVSHVVQYLAGTTTVTGGPGFQTKETIYGFGIDPNKKLLEIAMIKAYLLPNMPKLNFNLKNIAFTCSGTTIHFAADAVTPLIGTTPYENFPITKLSGTLDPLSGFSLVFDCAPSTVQGTTFTVSATGTYTDQPDQSDI